jgi:hypothetical protein
MMLFCINGMAAALWSLFRLHETFQVRRTKPQKTSINIVSQITVPFNSTMLLFKINHANEKKIEQNNTRIQADKTKPKTLNGKSKGRTSSISGADGHIVDVKKSLTTKRKKHSVYSKRLNFNRFDFFCSDIFCCIPLPYSLFQTHKTIN